MRWHYCRFGVTAFLIQRINQPIGPSGIPSKVSTDLINLPYYTLRSVFRMLIALVASLIFTIVYGSLAARSRRLGKVLIPLLDILQSVPILGFLSATVTIWLVIFPGSMLGVEAASIFAIFTSQAWNMTFRSTVRCSASQRNWMRQFVVCNSRIGNVSGC